MGADDSTSDGQTSNEFFEALTPLTGENPNLGSFFLVVGAVTCVFIAVFQFTLPEGIRFLLTAGVLLVAILSAIVASLLETLGYFDEDVERKRESEGTVGGDKNKRPWTPTSGTRYSLPPIINFDEELRAYYEMFDGDLPGEFDEFIREYKRLKTTRSNRANIASDLRADLNPISVLFEEGSQGMEIHDEISERLFRYVRNDAADQLSVTGTRFYDGDGEEVDVASVNDELARTETNIENEGEAVSIELVVALADGEGNLVRRDTYPVGTVNAGATRTFDTDVYVPANAERASTAITTSSPG